MNWRRWWFGVRDEDLPPPRPIGSRYAYCPHCGGIIAQENLSDAQPADGWAWCPRCNGRRIVGGGRNPSYRCPTCAGHGTVRITTPAPYMGSSQPREPRG